MPSNRAMDATTGTQREDMPLHPAPARLSACIITFNEADRIAGCLNSVAFCDEILVVDCGSTDGTVELARQHGARVLHNSWVGYRSQKQHAVNRASHDVILSIDADERVTDELRTEIESLRARHFQDGTAWTIPRLTDYCGRFLRHGNSYPDRTIRLFDRRYGTWAGYEVHESVKANGPVGELRGHLEHFSYRDLDDHLRRMQRYATLMADEMQRVGRRKGLGHVIMNPLWRFLRGMIIKRGYLDGWRGFAFHVVEARYVQEKYLRMWLASRLEGRSFTKTNIVPTAPPKLPEASEKPS